MPTIVIFIALAIVLSLLLAIIVLIPWLRSDNSARNSQLVALNVEVFQERLAELRDDYDNGEVSETEFKNQKTELERQLLQASDDKNIRISDNQAESGGVTSEQVLTAQREIRFTKSLKSRLTIFICVPILIILAYFLSGTRAPVYNLWQAQDKVGQVADDLMTGKIDVPPEWATEDSVGLLGTIQTNVHHHAHDAQRWIHLADVFLAFEANEQALESLARAYRLSPEDESVAVRYAQTQFFTSGGMLNGESRNVLLKVLQNNPNHQGAQMLMAMGEAREGNYDNAEAWIERLRTEIKTKDGDHSEALNSLDELSRNIAAQKVASMQVNPADGNVDATINSAQVIVTINSSLRPLIGENDILFVTIKQATGGAPLAVKQLPATQLLGSSDGLSIELSDNDAMMPTHTISSAIANGDELVVTARISKTGQAISESGDLTADTVPFKYEDASSPLTIKTEINQQVP